MPTPPYRLHLATPVWELNAKRIHRCSESRHARHGRVACRVACRARGAPERRGPDVERVRCGQRGQCSVEQSTPRPRVPRSKKTRMPKVRDRTRTRGTARTAERPGERSGSAGASAHRGGGQGPEFGGWVGQLQLASRPYRFYRYRVFRVVISFTNTNHHAVHALRNARERALDALWGAPVR